MDGEAGAREGALIGGRYRVLRQLGEGAMGAVHEAENTWTGRRVAVKLLKREFAADEEVVHRFLREARAAAQIAHPNIVDVLDMGRDESDGTLYIVQELLDGEDLRRHMTERGRLAPRDAVAILAPVMEALCFAHAKGVVHRDIKPENVFLARTSSGVAPTLIDFGISKAASRPDDKFRTKVGVVMGTPWYMPPEQALGQPVDARADVWSIGVVLYEMLAGRCPFETANVHHALLQIVSEPVPRVETFAPDVPPALAEVVHRALERDLPRRYPDMRSFLDALRACPLPAPPPPAPTLARAPTLPVSAATAPTAYAAPAPVAAAPSRRPLAFVALAVVAACIAVGALVALARHEPAAAPTAVTVPVAPAPPRAVEPVEAPVAPPAVTEPAAPAAPVRAVRPAPSPSATQQFARARGRERKREREQLRRWVRWGRGDD